MRFDLKADTRTAFKTASVIRKDCILLIVVAERSICEE